MSVVEWPVWYAKHNTNGRPKGPRVEHISEILGKVSDDPTHAPEGEDEDVKEELAELLSLVVHGGGGQQQLSERGDVCDKWRVA